MRILSILTAAVVLTCFVPLYAAAGETHSHSYTEANPMDFSFHEMLCSCGDSTTQPHSYDIWIAQDENCHLKVCACSASVTQAHSWKAADDSGTLVCQDCGAGKSPAVAVLEETEVITPEQLLRYYHGEAEMPSDLALQLDTNQNSALELAEIMSAMKQTALQNKADF